MNMLPSGMQGNNIEVTNDCISKATYIPSPSSPPLKGGEILQPSPPEGEGGGEGALLHELLISTLTITRNNIQHVIYL